METIFPEKQKRMQIRNRENHTLYFSHPPNLLPGFESVQDVFHLAIPQKQRTTLPSSFIVMRGRIGMRRERTGKKKLKL